MERKEFEKIIEICNSEGAVFETVHHFATLVAETKDPYLICDFCEYVDAADNADIMPILQNAILQEKNPLHWYEFAYLMCDCGRKNVDYVELQKKIEGLKDPKLIAYCREFVPAFDGNSLDEAMCECANYKWIMAYKNLLHFDDMSTWGDENPWFASLYYKSHDLEDQKNEGYDKVPRIVKNSVFSGPAFRMFDAYNIAKRGDNPYFTTTFAEFYCKGDKYSETLKELQEATEKSGDVLSVYEFGASVDGANIRRVENFAIKSGMAKYMYYVGAYCPDANLDRMLRHIKRTGNQKYIKKMEEHIEEVRNKGEE